MEVKTVVQKGEEIYANLKDSFDKQFFGKFLILEVESKDYFIGSTPLEALKIAKSKYPDKNFYLVRIGYKVAYSLKGISGDF